MFDFRFIYLNDNAYGVSDITKITIQEADGLKDISGDDILTANIPLQTMYLHSDNGNYTVLGDNLMAIEITKRET
ncbi:hypothetical protein [uncultured Bacteroides sp.]|uniref:hypothetical protein n=1 Tax=uncultured Bacteroides sp. TaxID=162156 RepID=UPI0026254801|nr:hypothetical protein [uncultured Bacteroides sp.]